MKALKDEGFESPYLRAVRRRAHQPDPLPARRARPSSTRRSTKMLASAKKFKAGVVKPEQVARAGGRGRVGRSRRNACGDPIPAIAHRWRSSSPPAVGAARAAATSPDLATAKVVDLTHAFDEKTIYWPNSPSAFELKQLSYGQTPGGWFYSVQHVLHARARRHAPRRADPLLEGRPDRGPDSRAAAHRARRRDRRPRRRRRPTPTTGSPSRT